MNNEFAYWIALSQIKGMATEKINQLIINIIHRDKIELSEFFVLSVEELSSKYEISQAEISALELTKTDLPKYSFVAEDLLAQGFEIITIDSPKYSKTLKDNLKIKSSPPVLFTKGNTKLLQEDSAAIVGSRDADAVSLQFTDNIAKSCSKQFKVIVSGFAKGVDKQALDSALKYKGQSIIVLPQGILTFGSGINLYYSQIQTGDVLVLSTFFPKAPWSAQLAMARNTIIYGLAKEIYVAQSSDKGGTWSGVVDGLRKGRRIFVRQPDTNEKNANNLLIEMGANAVDFMGNLIEENHPQTEDSISLESRIVELLAKSALTADEILKKLNLDWKTIKMTNFLKQIDGLIVTDSRPKKYSYGQSTTQDSLFGAEDFQTPEYIRAVSDSKEEYKA